MNFSNNPLIDSDSKLDVELWRQLTQDDIKRAWELYGEGTWRMLVRFRWALEGEATRT